MISDNPLAALHGDPAQAPVQWQGRFIAVQKTGAGWEFVTRASGPLAVVICALTPQGEILLVEQYRVPCGCSVLEFPAGLVGDVPGESHLDESHDVLATAQRELIEECGFQAEKIELLGSGPVSAGLTDETLCIVRATGLSQVGPGGGVVGEEAITVHKVLPKDLALFCQERQAAGVALDIKLNLGLAALGLAPLWLPPADC